MNARDFAQTSIGILRCAFGWQTAIAEKLDVTPRSVRRWIKNDAVPEWAAQRLIDLRRKQGRRRSCAHVTCHLARRENEA
jgi:DNA-binding transcriptional regulator YiaG